MSYDIIFETKVVKLPDGRIIHFSRSGCNNDNAGRRKDEFEGKIYTVEAYKHKAEHFKLESKPYEQFGHFDLKIGSRPATYFDYGEHLLRMLKRAPDYDTFIKTYNFRAQRVTGIELLKPEHKMLTCEEFEKLFYANKYDMLSYRRIIEYPNTLEEIVKRLETGQYLEFYINKLKVRKNRR